MSNINFVENNLVNKIWNNYNKKKSYFFRYLFISLKIMYIYLQKITYVICDNILKYTSILFYNILEILSKIIIVLKISLEKYIRKKKYSDLNQYGKKYTKSDIAWLSLAISDTWTTIPKIMEKPIGNMMWYHYVYSAYKLSKDKLKAIGIIKNHLKDERLTQELIKKIKEDEYLEKLNRE